VTNRIAKEFEYQLDINCRNFELVTPLMHGALRHSSLACPANLLARGIPAVCCALWLLRVICLIPLLKALQTEAGLRAP
jgi:hypothetical protein